MLFRTSHMYFHALPSITRHAFSYNVIEVKCFLRMSQRSNVFLNVAREMFVRRTHARCSCKYNYSQTSLLQNFVTSSCGYDVFFSSSNTVKGMKHSSWSLNIIHDRCSRQCDSTNHDSFLSQVFKNSTPFSELFLRLSRTDTSFHIYNKYRKHTHIYTFELTSHTHIYAEDTGLHKQYSLETFPKISRKIMTRVFAHVIHFTCGHEYQVV